MCLYPNMNDLMEAPTQLVMPWGTPALAGDHPSKRIDHPRACFSGAELANWMTSWIDENCFPLLGWQRDFLRGTFGDAEIQTASLTVARGNGKSTLAGAVAAFAIATDAFGAAAETIIVGASIQQARTVFDACLRFLEPRLRAEGTGTGRAWGVSDSIMLLRVHHRPSRRRVRCLGSEPRRLHGAIPALILADEGAQWERGLAMYSALRTALGKRAGARALFIGTRPAEADHWFSRLIDGAVESRRHFGMRFSAPRDCDPFAPANWALANPSLAAMPELHRTIQNEADEARQDAGLLQQFLALRLNAGTPDVRQSVVLDPDTWTACERDDLPAREGPCFWGLDLGAAASMSAVAAFWPATDRLEVLGAFSAVPDLDARDRRDAADGRYHRMVDAGEVIICGEATTDIRGLLDAALERFGGRPDAIVGDRFRAVELRHELRKKAFPATALIFRGLGWRDADADLREFRRAALEGEIAVGRSLLMRSALSEARTVLDPSGNEKVDKRVGEGRRQQRDDALIAALLAVGEGRRHKDAGARPAFRVV